MVMVVTLDRLREIIPAPNAMAFAKIRDSLCSQGVDFVARCPFLILSTWGDRGIELSPKGGNPGFVQVLDRATLLIPEYPGNQFALSLSNIVCDGRVGLMLLRPATDEVLRVSGRAILDDDAGLCARFAAEGRSVRLVIRVAIERAAFHCVRSVRRASLWDPASWDAPTRISFGKIYAEALGKPEVRPLFDDSTDQSNATLY